MSALYVHPEIDQAKTLPASFYTSTEWFERAKEAVFAKSWQFCLSAEAVSQPGQLYPHTLLPGILDESILFSRDQENILRCLSNVCTHRANLLVDKPCVNRHILCRYHGRRFKLCGEFQHMPEFDLAKNFPTADDHLPQIPFAQLGNFLFASAAPTLSFDDVLGEVKQRLFWLPFDKMFFDQSHAHDYTVQAHWALYCENYLEALHIPFVHKALRSVLDFANYRTELYRYSNLQLALSSPGEESFDLPSDSLDFGKQVAAYYYWIFPNTMLNFYPWGCSVNVVQPISPGLTKVSFLPFVLDASKLNKGAGGDLNTVEMEDEAVVESVQKGIRSRFYNHGRYSPTLETGTHHFHRLLCEFLN